MKAGGIIIILIIGIVLFFTFNMWYPLISGLGGSKGTSLPSTGEKGGTPTEAKDSGADTQIPITTATDMKFPAFIADPTVKGGQVGVLKIGNESVTYYASEFQQGWVSEKTAAGMAIKAEEKALADLKSGASPTSQAVVVDPRVVTPIPTPSFGGGSAGEPSGVSGSW